MSKNPDSIAKLLPIRMVSKIVKGFGRGSKDLGIPTANLSRDEMKCKIEFDGLPTGIYWGFARISEQLDEKGEMQPHQDLINERVYKAAISIGYNPCYGNETKTVEPHLIAPSLHPKRTASKCDETEFDDFYDRYIRLSIVGHLRPELPFEGLEKLTLAIKDDIANTEELCDGVDDVIVAERNWVDSVEPA